jgi:hypothetical protein
MPARRYRCTWDDIAYLDADHMARWGAFAFGCRETITFEDGLPELAFEMHNDRNEFVVVYKWQAIGHPPDGPFVRSRIVIDRRPCRYGGDRIYFRCPCCGRRTLRLAVLPEGLRCGACGRVTWASRRETRTERLMRRGNKIAAKLDLGAWHDLPEKRPRGMRVATFVRLKAELAAERERINRQMLATMPRSLFLRLIMENL